MLSRMTELFLLFMSHGPLCILLAFINKVSNPIHRKLTGQQWPPIVDFQSFPRPGALAMDRLVVRTDKQNVR